MRRFGLWYATAAAVFVATGCAGTRAGVRSERTPNTRAIAEFMAARAAVDRPETYAGSHPCIATTFAAIAARDAGALARAGFTHPAEVVANCAERNLEYDEATGIPYGLSLRVRVLPTPRGIALRVCASCSRRPEKDGAQAYRIADAENVIDDLPITEDPDAEEDAAAIETAYRYTVRMGEFPYIGGLTVRAPTDLNVSVAEVIAAYRAARAGKISVRVERASHRTTWQLTWRTEYVVHAGMLNHAYGLLAGAADYYGGNDDGVATPWEIAKLTYDIPTLLVVANGKANPEVISWCRGRGMPVDDATSFVDLINAIDALAGAWVITDNDRPEDHLELPSPLEEPEEPRRNQT